MTTFKTVGATLQTPLGVDVILRGVNLPLLDDWRFPGGDHLDDVETSGANCVRIQWYVNYGDEDRPAYSVTDLDGFLARCKALKMLPIVGLWDLTCKDDATRLNSELMPWWTDPATVAVLNAHQDYLIINPANELGVYHWSPTPSAALKVFRDEYITAIHNLRRVGLQMPIMIDAPDCGTSLDAFTAILDPLVPVCVGNQLIEADPLHNILLSAHAYWAGTDHTAVVDEMVRLNLPFVLGEIANKQFDAGDQCHFGIDGTGKNFPPPTGFKYQDLLTKLKPLNIGWLAWAWRPDGCPARNMAVYDATETTFINLTHYGNDIVNNPSYGLKATAVRF